MTAWLIPALAMVSAAAATSASAQPAAAAQSPAAHVAAHAVAHPGDGLTVRIPEAAAYVGGDRFVLYDVADCEIHVFVEADARHRVRRLYWIQFEGYLPSLPERRYNYVDGNRRIDLGGTPTWVRAAPANVSQAPRAGSDRERVVAILTRAGFVLPADVLSVRMVQLPDDPQGTGHGRRELMMMYVEDLAPLGVTPADFMTDGAPNARWAATEQPLIERAVAAFRVERR
jgi:hypothetical protein